MSIRTNSDEVGIVVIGRNEGRRLVNCLASVKRCANNIVYVDSGSTDDSAATAERSGAWVVRLDPTQPFTAARARNEGFAALKMLKPDIRFVQFVDGDCELVHGWLVTALSFIRNQKNIAIVCGRRRESHPEMSVYNRLCDIEWDTPIGESLACGGDSLMRVEAFEEVTGFIPKLIAGEEPELCVRLRERGWKVWRLDAEMTRHDAAMRRFGQWWLRAVRSGYGGAEVSLLHIHSPFGIYRRETVRAAFWSGLLPLSIGLCALIHPAAMLGLLIYPVQVCRVAFVRGPTALQSWIYALFVMLAKFGELQGMLKFCWRFWRGQTAELIEYKQAGNTRPPCPSVLS